MLNTVSSSKIKYCPLIPINFPFISETKELSNLRKEVRKFISEALINKEFEPAADGWVFSANPNFSKKLGTKGWLGMSFPKKYGGNEKTALERYIVTEELLDSGAHVNVLDISSQKLKDLEKEFGTNNISYISSTPESISSAISKSDLVIGSVYVVGKEAPKVITRKMLNVMKPGSVLVDISIDQGGCVETSKPTTHDDPVFVEEGVAHYCVTNMPVAVPLTASLALNHATLPFIKKIADLGLKTACYSDNHLANGLNMANGEIRHPSVQVALNS